MSLLFKPVHLQLRTAVPMHSARVIALILLIFWAGTICCRKQSLGCHNTADTYETCHERNRCMYGISARPLPGDHNWYGDVILVVDNAGSLPGKMHKGPRVPYVTADTMRAGVAQLLFRL